MPQVLPRTLQPPPDVPNLGADQNTLAQYLRNFALWCRHGFADKLSISQAAPGIMIQAVDSVTGEPTPFTYLIGVEANVTGGGAPTSPSITFKVIPLGSGKP